jgi:3-isopropylmalate/(R)-2-methylmalate dehydratase small subunit
MALEKIINRTGRAIPIPGDDIDTDRIIPARFMKCVTFDGLGEYLFYDVRKNIENSDTAHNLNKDRYQGASILISGNNFGCGSSREHAPQAISKAGYVAVIAEGFAEIFLGNSTQLGLPCASISHEDRLKLCASVENDPIQEISIDLLEEVITYNEGKLPFNMKNSNRQALIEGCWDPLQDLMENLDEIDRVASTLFYIN